MAADRFVLPVQQLLTATPTVRTGHKLKFYASETDTPLEVFSDSDLETSIGTTITLNSLGQWTSGVFLQNAAYKVVLTDADDVVVWTFDPVYGAQYSTKAQVESVNGDPNGQLAGTAGSVGVLASMAWDFTTGTMYVCTSTGTSSTAVWTAINAATAAAAIVPPQGRLTLTSATPVIAAEVTAATTVYYTPYNGASVPIYNGSAFVATAFAEMSLGLVSAHAADTIYDVFVFSNSGVLTLVTGPAWTNSGGGTSSRGSGAGTTQLTRINGLLVNAVSMTGRNGSTTYSIDANRATYLGSILIDGSAGQVTCHTTWGQTRRWGVWNMYNRVPIVLSGGDSTATWTYSSGTVRASNGNSANKLIVLTGRNEERIQCSFLQAINPTAGSPLAVGIGINSTTALSGTGGGSIGGADDDLVHRTRAEHTLQSALGMNEVQSLESGAGLLVGQQLSMNLMAQWNG